jgi:hypothetical protein
VIKIVPQEPVLDQIRRDHPNWLGRAEEKRKAAIAAGKVGDGDGIWSDIKGLFIRAQHYKCGYCEEPMAEIAEGKTEGIGVDYDIEHFRPKNRVQEWPTAEVLAERPGIDYGHQVAAGPATGYVRLAFEPQNYLVSCKLCNSYYKRDRFPIAGQPEAVATQRADLDAVELPLLLFPFGEDGDDPEKLLTFEGAAIGPLATLAGYDRLRARVVIDFFELDSRAGLLQGRSAVIKMLFPELEQRGVPDADSFVEALQSARFPYAACARAFVRLYDEDPEAAQRHYLAARAYLQTKDPTIWR